MSQLLANLRLGLRALSKAPGYTIAVLVTLTLAIGVNVFLFSLVEGVLLRPLPYRDPGRLVTVWSDDGTQTFEISVPNFLDLQAQSRSFAGIAALYPYYTGNLTGGGRPERLNGALLTSSVLPLLGAHPALGRAFTAAEEKADAPVVLLSDRVWRQRFGADRGVLGRGILLDGSSMTIIGVMPPGFAFPNSDVDLWLPLRFTPRQMERRAAQILHVVARLSPGATMAQAQEDVTRIAKELQGHYPQTNAGINFKVVSLLDQQVGGLRRGLLALQVAVVFLLLLACANASNLTLTRVLNRRWELGLRSALGAQPRELLLALLAESAILAAASTALGLFLAFELLRVLRSLNLPSLPRLDEVHLATSPVLLFIVGLLVVTILLSGLAPAIQGARLSRPMLAIREASRGSGVGPGRRLRNGLAVLQIAIALVLLIGAALMIRSFVALGRVDPGFKTENLLAFKLSLPEPKYASVPRKEAFFDEALQRIRRLPGVQNAGIVDLLPLSGGSSSWITIEGRPAPQSKPPEIQWRESTSDYFKVMGIPLRRGRLFTSGDTPEAPLVGVISQSAADHFWPGENPLGKRVKIGPSPDEPWVTIVGVVGDVRDFGLDSKFVPTIYQFISQRDDAERTVVVRTAGDPQQALPAIEGQIWSLDPDLPVYGVQTIDDLLRGSIAKQRLGMLLMAFLGSMALIVAVAGVYGVLSYLVGQRGTEFGIRMALGADRTKILGMVLREGGVLIALASLVGLACSLAATRLLTGLLFGVSAFDPVTLAGVILLLAGVGLFACYLPARRATRVEPSIVLRES